MSVVSLLQIHAQDLRLQLGISLLHYLYEVLFREFFKCLVDNRSVNGIWGRRELVRLLSAHIGRL